MFSGTMINPDKGMVREIKKAIKKHNGYCPNKEMKTIDTKCPCKDYRETGYCDCGLYIKDITNLINESF